MVVPDFPYLYGSNLSWLVGVLEGEGCFLKQLKIHPSGNKYYVLKVKVAMNDVDTVYKISHLVGEGRVFGPYCKKDYHPYWEWNLQNTNAYSLMKLVLPMMSYRRSRKIEELLSIYERNKEEGITNKSRNASRIMVENNRRRYACPLP